MKQHGYLYATFGALILVGVILLSLSYCSGKSDAKIDARDLIIEQNNEEIERLESALDVAQDKTIKAIEKSKKTQQKLEIKIYQYDQLRKKTIIIPNRNTDVYDDSLVRIWTNQNKE
jgi:hypothetical protein